MDTLEVKIPTQAKAQAVLESYEELLAALRPQVGLPKIQAHEKPWDCKHLRKLFWSQEDYAFIAQWSRYIGCGETERRSTYHNLEDLLPKQASVSPNLSTSGV